MTETGGTNGKNKLGKTKGIGNVMARVNSINTKANQTLLKRGGHKMDGDGDDKCERKEEGCDS